MTNKTEFILAIEGEDSPVIVLSQAKATEFHAAPVGSDEQQLQYHLLSASTLRMLANAGHILTSKGTYRLVTDPKMGQMVLAGAKGTPGLFRGFTRSGGRIIKHAKFKPVSGARLANVAMLAFEVATIVTSTQHLKEIGQHLKEINDTLLKVQALIDDQRLGKIQGNILYLREALTLLNSGSLSQEDRSRYDRQLDAIYRETLAEIQTNHAQLQRRIHELEKEEKVKVKGRLFWKKPSQQAQKQLEQRVLEFSGTLGIALLAQETAAATCAVLTQLGRGPAQTQHRLALLETDVESLKREWVRYADILEVKFEEVRDHSEIRKERLKLANHLKSYRERPKVLLKSVKLIQEQVNLGPPLELLVRFDGGEVVDVRRVLPAASDNVLEGKST